MFVKCPAYRRKGSCAKIPSAKCSLAAYMDGINAAPISPGARYLAGMIALKLEYIATVMRDYDLSFIEAVVSADSDKRVRERDVQLLLDECGEVGILERGRIAGKQAALPRIPDWVRPC